jgi:hypothetical protein
MTYDDLKKMFDQVLKDGISSYLRAPQRRGWSRLAGQPIPSKNDIANATNANLRYLESIRAERFADKPALLQEEEDVKIVS